MISYKSTRKDFKETYNELRQNSLLVENLLEKEEIDDGINIWNDYDLERYFPEILLNTEFYSIKSDIEMDKYRYNPKKLSLDIYGVSDYWMIIMKMNNFTKVKEFDNLRTILVPSRQLLSSIITRIEREGQKR